VSGCTENSKN